MHENQKNQNRKEAEMAEIKKAEEAVKGTKALAVEVSSAAEEKKPVKAAEKKNEAGTSGKEEKAKKAPAKKTQKAADKTKDAAKETKKPEAKTEAAAAEKEKDVKPRGRQGGRRSAKSEVIHIQIDGKDYTREQLIQSARDIWVYDMKRKLSEFNSIELYINVNESRAYYVINDDVTGSFDI